MYDGDSFFTLSVWGQVGLACLSVALAAICLLVQWSFARWLWGFVLAALIFYVFVYVSPQVYYTYYRFIFDGLPAQWVISPPGLGEIINLLTFRSGSNLSAHSQGALGWSLIGVALIRFRL